MLRIPKSVDYGILILIELIEAGTLLNAKEIAQRCSISPQHTAKLLKQLHKAGLVTSKRGATGGYKAVGEAEKLTVGRVYEILEGPLIFAECMEAETVVCQVEGSCRLKPHLSLISHAIEDVFHRITLRAIIHENKPIHSFQILGGIAL